MKKVFCCILILFSLIFVSCGKKNKTWINSCLPGNYEKKQPSVKDDFYQAVNYEWIKENQKVNKEKGLNSRAADFSLSVQDQVLQMIEDPECRSHEEKLVKLLYTQLADEKARNETGFEPAKIIVEKIKAASSFEELWNTACDKDFPDCIPLISYFYNTDNLNSNIFVPAFVPSTTLGSSLAYISENIVKNKKEFKTNKKYFEKMLKKCGWSEKEAKNAVNEVFEFEKRLLLDHLGQKEVTIQAPYTPQNFKLMFPNIPLFEILEGMGGRYQRVVLGDVKMMKNLNALITEENLEAFKNEMIFRFLADYGRFLDLESRDLYLEKENQLRKISLKYSEWDKAYLDLHVMDEILNEAWLNRYFSEEIKSEVTELTEFIIEKYKNRFEEADWISQRTKLQALEKLDNIKYLIGSGTMNNYSDFDFYDNSEEYALFKNIIRIRKQQEKNDIIATSGLNKKDKWLVLKAMDWNAFYQSADNSINVCAGILSGKIYQPDFPLEKKLAGIGFTIGHEISHSFDINGGGNDKDGNQIFWWDGEDFQKLQEKSKKIGTAAAAEDCKNIQAGNTKFWGEVTADAGAMAVCLDIASGYENFDYDLFFRHFAESWGEMLDPKVCDFREKVDSHPLNFVRVNFTLQQYEKFYEVYDIKPGDRMYRSPEERCRVW